MSAEASRNQDIYRIADSLERIALALENISETYLGNLGRQGRKQPF
jgi:hypothetical protein